MYYLKLYLATLLAFVVIDGLWLGVVAKNLYQKHLGEMLRDNPNWLAAILFYLLFIGGLVIFAILPGLQSESAKKPLLLGALFGLMTYATYDLTNLATLKGWPLKVTVVDLIWGTILAGSVSLCGFMAGRWMG
ncbi:MAG: DUF2177 family protein [Candidatus Omnitrophica bacterium]|nr:DUF2177 family protein [Candidatus Omnitrophota bacterium]